MKHFLLFLQFFTKIPVPFHIDFDADEFAKGIIYLPVIGLVIGLFQYLAYCLAILVGNRFFACICIVFLNIAITGAFHLDGLADMADGLFSSRNKDRMLEIMRDSRLGTNGAAAVLFDILFKISLLYSIKDENLRMAVILFPAVARGAMPVLLYNSVYARKDGLGNLLIGKVSLLHTMLTFVYTFFLSFLFLGYEVLPGVLICFIVIYGYRIFVQGRIGGLTGDILGGGVEIAEIIMLMFINTI